MEENASEASNLVSVKGAQYELAEHPQRNSAEDDRRLPTPSSHTVTNPRIKDAPEPDVRTPRSRVDALPELPRTGMGLPQPPLEHDVFNDFLWLPLSLVLEWLALLVKHAEALGLTSALHHNENSNRGRKAKVDAPASSGSARAPARRGASPYAAPCSRGGRASCERTARAPRACRADSTGGVCCSRRARRRAP
jgi:hypothetical protein